MSSRDGWRGIGLGTCRVKRPLARVRFRVTASPISDVERQRPPDPITAVLARDAAQRPRHPQAPWLPFREGTKTATSSRRSILMRGDWPHLSPQCQVRSRELAHREPGVQHRPLGPTQLDGCDGSPSVGWRRIAELGVGQVHADPPQFSARIQSGRAERGARMSTCVTCRRVALVASPYGFADLVEIWSSLQVRL